MSWITVLDYFGLVVFAISGCMIAAEKRLDMVGFAFFAITTGVGGGTFRDVVLGRLPVFWVQDPTPMILCGIVATGCYFVVHRIRNYQTALVWADAIGLATFSVIGAQIALSMDVSWPICVVMGGATASFGGMVRDVLAQRPSIILQQEVYITAALVGAASYLLLLSLGLSMNLAAPIAIVSAFIVRGTAIIFNLRLPAFTRF